MATLAIVRMTDGTLRYRSWMPRWIIKTRPHLNVPLFPKEFSAPGRSYPTDELCAFGWQVAGYPSGYPDYMMLLENKSSGARFLNGVTVKPIM
jgi:hypothetical protein